MNHPRILATICVAMWIAGCWDNPVHKYESLNSRPNFDLDRDGGIDAGTDPDTDSEPAGNGQGDLPPGFENFGAPCETDKDCAGYSERARCLEKNILGLINVPGGYCTACCDRAGSVCAGAIQCIGLDEVYLICAAPCDSHADCRQDEGYECRPIPPYLDTSKFPGTFCLPDEEHIEPGPKDEPSDPHCDWPWIKE